MEPAKSKNEAIIARARDLANVPWCEEYEKMISGMLNCLTLRLLNNSSYNAFVPELLTGRFRARKLASQYNAPIPDEMTEDELMSKRAEILKKFFGSLGKNSCIEPPLNVDYGCNILVGDDFYSNFGLTILDCCLVEIGDRVMFGPNVSILSATHQTDVQSRRDGVEFALPVFIGDDCWIGGNVSILPGVTIGNGCTIGAGSVVTKSIPAFSVAVGSPARVIKKVKEAEPVPKK
ncbi:hypothetical protein D6D13_00644 [Aureobasidium pullulans]|uniref:Maltose/galactoside acetyltransferase domain-containing protein n=1 Tax=Aureobasidium pullulans TaxID=5580 RepID=A0A4V4J2N3_AURPU|nr:hypothetical protein D6D13_00644 [Aureobasidium pullulans]THX26170.1 hypothetical protein D6D12_06383 [Aureobasidium pullulans]THX44670.1 hypothetical protein D6D11_07845 [Aureobasidium pullulans]TIA72339.1 hypothetical protein D6C76_06952 [Aureobasidium pullulans]CAD0044513.1 unnamed protein product [Aureobasidium pullulans]